MKKNFEILIVDNNSNDGTYIYIKENCPNIDNIRYVLEKKQSLAQYGTKQPITIARFDIKNIDDFYEATSNLEQ